ncbi:hypothetical protein PF005_g5863 [Phytophthora fragariae]|uniref:Uncharacterized protein n=2 Tax=Phytophthora fragariae TaxID=53985 RepID=A0A6A3LU56_9STRA|nr:hypothetical protein PF011_g4842 [Phytophthora fragariae]KAE9125692.1 hypothetical protein PF007_g6269 [Phytophthora fragariae]KAE9224595.1 hypothetical protein PF005_g5863 [Phytophthora fragariae]
MVTDVTAITVPPPSSLSPQEWDAHTQTLFFQMGFRFRNGFQAHASRMDPSLAPSVVEELQKLLTVEFLEWQDVVSGVTTRIVSALSLQALNDDA